jgi:hypothetical protein
VLGNARWLLTKSEFDGHGDNDRSEPVDLCGYGRCIQVTPSVVERDTVFVYAKVRTYQPKYTITLCSMSKDRSDLTKYLSLKSLRNRSFKAC